MICKLCDQEKKLIKAHIIPEGFFRPLQSESRAAEIHTNTMRVHPKRSLIGFYDKNILCEDCDGKLGVWDEYAQKLLLLSFSEDNALYDNKEKIAYEIKDYDYLMIKLFFISLLWRASITTQEYFDRINVRPFEEKLKDLILSESPGMEDEFPVTLAKFSDPSFKGMLDPHKDRFDNINYCRFYMTGFVAYIKVDKRQSIGMHEMMKIKEGQPIFIILRDLHGSKDGIVMKDIVSKIRK